MDTYLTDNEVTRQELMKLIDSGESYIITVKPATDKSKRTLTQNASIHKYCTMLAEAYNEAGLDLAAVLSKQADIPWNMQNVKEQQWRRIQLALELPESTTKLETTDVTKVYEVLNRFSSDRFGIGIPFPSIESMRMNSILKIS